MTLRSGQNGVATRTVRAPFSSQPEPASGIAPKNALVCSRSRQNGIGGISMENSGASSRLRKANPKGKKLMAKRGNSEGSIFQLPDGRWCAFVSNGYRNGKRWRKKYTAS